MIINRIGANVSPCSTPASIVKKSVSPSEVITAALVFVYNDLITFKNMVRNSVEGQNFEHGLC